MNFITEENFKEYSENISPDLISFDCGEGWKDLLLEALAVLSGTPAKIVQVKEKFGGLRIYADNLTREQDNRLLEIEKKSLRICESCGTKEEVTREGSWIKTFCKTCRIGRHKSESVKVSAVNPKEELKISENEADNIIETVRKNCREVECSQGDITKRRFR
jgi:hypothetical protein